MSIKSLVILFILASISCSAAVADRWDYVDPWRSSESFSIHTSPGYFQIDDVMQDAKICEDADKYICVTSKGFEFYVPKNLNSEISQWKVNGIEFVSHIDKKLQIFGIKDEIYLIENKSSKGIRYLYSKTRGLIGMGGVTENSSSIFLLTQNCGFGAPPACKK